MSQNHTKIASANNVIKTAKPFRVALAGMGVVGGGVYALLARNHAVITERTGRSIIVTDLAARDQAKAKRMVEQYALDWPHATHQPPKYWDNAAGMAAKADVDAVIEVIGGANGIAYDIAQNTLKRGLPLVTANKALLATHGVTLAQTAEAHHTAIGCEAAVAGGIPIIKALREGLAANRITSVIGILNGTCNYILSSMRSRGVDFPEILREAQELGYAEADPSFDIDGTDSGHKLALLAAMAFGIAPNLDALTIEGIRNLTRLDSQYAEELGYRLKLLGLAERSQIGQNDSISLRVLPALVPEKSAMANVDGVLNAVMVQGDFVGLSFYQGRGAGAEPTASAVISDIVDFARMSRVEATHPGGKYHAARPLFGVAVADLKKLPIIPSHDYVAAWYLRLTVRDQPGVIADIATALRDHGVSLETVTQHRHHPGESVPVVLTTHPCREGQIRGVLGVIANLPALTDKPQLLRILPD
ncbi:MAG: homoserine dehydrogenase [Alphaproteobacteria bacterium]|nr:homoserine dehydrogenase [Alphaproteobacteria bacterium]